MPVTTSTSAEASTKRKRGFDHELNTLKKIKCDDFDQPFEELKRKLPIVQSADRNETMQAINEYVDFLLYVYTADARNQTGQSYNTGNVPRYWNLFRINYIWRANASKHNQKKSKHGVKARRFDQSIKK